MPNVELRNVVHHLRRLAAPAGVCLLNDAQLLHRFVQCRDAAAFEALVWRHAGLVFAVCRNLLRTHQDTEDAFQATFLTLARRPPSSAKDASLAGWLHQVSSRIALRMAAQARRRQAREHPHYDLAVLAAKSRRGSITDIDEREIWGLVLEELGRLPGPYRTALIACYLEGKTHKQAAQDLCRPLGSISGLLAGGCEMLRTRLTRRRLALTVGAVGAALAESARASPGPTTVVPAVTAALEFSNGVAASGRAAVLANWVLASMLLSKVKVAGTVCLGFCALAIGAAGLIGQAQLQGRSEATAQRVEAATDSQQPIAMVDRYGDPLPPGATARLGTSRLKHAGGQSLAFAADGKSLCTAGGDRILRYWDIADGRLLRAVPIPLPGDVLAMSGDGRLLAMQTYQTGAAFTVWDVEHNQVLHKLPLDDQKGALHLAGFSPNGNTLVTAEAVGNIRAWDLAFGNGQLAGEQNRRRSWTQPLALSFAADGTLLSPGYENNPGRKRIRLRFWNVISGRELPSFAIPGADDNVTEVTISPNGKTVCSWQLGEKNTNGLRFWDVATGKPAESWVSVPGPACSAQFAPDGKTVAISTAMETFIWDPLAGKRVRTLSGGDGYDLTFSPDGKSLAAFRMGLSHYRHLAPSILLWDVSSGKARADTEQGHMDAVQAVALSPDGKTVASASSDILESVSQVCLWDAATAKLLLKLPQTRLIHRAVAFSADGSQLFVGAYSGIHRLEVATGREVAQYAFDPDPDPSSDFSKFMELTDDGRTLMGGMFVESESSTHSGQLVVRGWDVETGKRVKSATFSLSGSETSFAGQSSFSPDGRLIAIPGGLLCETATGRKLGRLSIRGEKLSKVIAFSPDSALFAAAQLSEPQGEKNSPDREREIVQAWETDTLLPVAQVEAGKVGHLAFSANGRQLITAGQGGLCQWDLVSEKKLASLAAPDISRMVYESWFTTSLALADDARTAVTGNQDTTVLLWNLAPVSRTTKAPSDWELEAGWQALTSEQANIALAAVEKLSDSNSVQIVKFLGDRLKPSVGPSEDEFRQLLARLEGNRFEQREAATKRLAELGDWAESRLRQAMGSQLAPEVRRRIETILGAFSPPIQTVEGRRSIRAVRVLESIGTPEAKKVLEKLARGHVDARLTCSAKAALERLAKPARSDPSRK